MKIKTFSLPAGKTCPGASDCKSMAVMDKETGKTSIKDGLNCQFRCFAASDEVKYPNVYNARKHNLDELKEAKSLNKMIELIEQSL